MCTNPGKSREFTGINHSWPSRNGLYQLIGSDGKRYFWEFHAVRPHDYVHVPVWCFAGLDLKINSSTQSECVKWASPRTCTEMCGKEVSWNRLAYSQHTSEVFTFSEYSVVCSSPYRSWHLDSGNENLLSVSRCQLRYSLRWSQRLNSRHQRPSERKEYPRGKSNHTPILILNDSTKELKKQTWLN